MDQVEAVIKNMERQIQNTDGKVQFDILFNEKFMKEYTDFTTINELFEKGGFKLESEEDLIQIDEKDLDEHIKNNTKFNSWEEMKQSAGALYIKKQLGFK